MESLTVTRAYVRFGAPVPRGQQPLSALATDGAVVLCCRAAGLARQSRDVLRYQDALSTNRATARQQAALATHLVLARDSACPVRLVIVNPGTELTKGTVGVRPDLVGKVTAFDGDAFTVDFERIAEPVAPKVKSRRRR
jgi:hypothetical protein